MKITGCCLPYGESKYHDAVQVGAFADQDGAQVPLVRDFFKMDDEDNIIGHCVLHDTPEGVMCDIYFNERYLSNHTVDGGFCSHLKIGAWAVQIKKEPILSHELPTSKFGNNFVVTDGRIVAVAMNEYCLERVVIEDD
jgi:hypothetical protein